MTIHQRIASKSYFDDDSNSLLQIPTKTHGEIYDFYRSWKQTKYYKTWKQRGKERTKALFLAQMLPEPRLNAGLPSRVDQGELLEHQ